MKKLMIAATIVCVAALSQAATVDWSVATVRAPKDSTGEYAVSGNIGSAGTLSIFLVDEDTYGKLTFDQAFYNTYSTKKADYSDATSNMGSRTLTSADKYKKDDHVYAAILLTYNDGKDTWFVANKADVVIQEFDGVAQDASITGLNTKLGGESGGIFSGDAIKGWTKAEAAPEPTSAMLLLIGMAGLALRRGRRS